jgi:hypothetical protein
MRTQKSGPYSPRGATTGGLAWSVSREEMAGSGLARELAAIVA